jgi:hypothetical protein
MTTHHSEHRRIRDDLRLRRTLAAEAAILERLTDHAAHTERRLAAIEQALRGTPLRTIAQPIPHAPTRCPHCGRPPGTTGQPCPVCRPTPADRERLGIPPA